MKVKSCWAIFSFLQATTTGIPGGVETSKLLGCKTKMSPYILCNVSSFSKLISPKLFGISASNLHRQLKLLCSFDIQRVNFISLIRERKTYANEAKCKQRFATEF